VFGYTKHLTTFRDCGKTSIRIIECGKILYGHRVEPRRKCGEDEKGISFRGLKVVGKKI
jgi:hypothetical protein